jgi:phosphoglucomutase
VTARLGRRLYEVPVGFKWFVPGLVDGSLGFVGEESAGATCLRRDGTVWTTDKDGIVLALLAAEMMAVTQRDPAEIYAQLTQELGAPAYTRRDVSATPEDRAAIAQLTPEKIRVSEVAGSPVQAVLTTAPGNGAPLSGVKVVAKDAWFAVRPSGTELILKVYAESFRGEEHLRAVLGDAQAFARSVAGAAVG